MPYTKTAWSDGITKLGPTNLNKIENGVFAGYATCNVQDTAYGAVGDGTTDDTAAIQAAANDAATGNIGKVLFFPPGNYKITSSITIPAGVSVLGSGLSSALKPNGCDGLHLQGPWGSVGPYFIRDLYIAGTSCTNFAAIRVDGALVSGDSVSGYEISNVRIDSFGYGMFLRNLWRSSIYQVRMVNVYYGVYLKGQNLVLNFNGVVCDKGTPPGTPTGAVNSAGFTCSQASDYNPGGNTVARPESIRVSNSQFVNFDIGVDHQHCLVAHYSGLDLDFSGVYGIRYNQSDGSLTFQGDWIAMTGTSAVAGIYAQALGSGSSSAVTIEGFHITNYQVSSGSRGIYIDGLQNNVSIRSCYVGPSMGGQDFQSQDILIAGTGGASGISIADTVCASSTPTNSVLIGSAGSVTGRAANLTTTKGVSVGSSSGGLFSVDLGKEVGYDQITTTVNVTGTTSAAPTTIITCAAHTFDGSPVLLRVFAERFSTPSAAAGNQTTVGLYESGSLVAILSQAQTPAAGQVGYPLIGELRFTPTAGSHTYTIAAWASNTTGTPAVSAGNGSAGNAAPAYARFTKV